MNNYENTRNKLKGERSPRVLSSSLRHGRGSLPEPHMHTHAAIRPGGVAPSSLGRRSGRRLRPPAGTSGSRGGRSAWPRRWGSRHSPPPRWGPPWPGAALRHEILLRSVCNSSEMTQHARRGHNHLSTCLCCDGCVDLSCVASFAYVAFLACFPNVFRATHSN